MLKVGLTGGIGSGKSEVTRRLAAKGAVVVDADLLAREVVEPGTPGYQAVVGAFGPEVLGADGDLDREQLGRVVFADPDARRRLNEIVHPLVRRETARRFAAAPADAIVVNDVPLLVETGLAGSYDVVVVVAAAPAEQVTRLCRHRGLSEDDAQARIAAQAPLEEKLAVADYVVRNDGSLADLDSTVDRLWAELRRRAATGSD